MATRSLRKSPGFLLTAILTIAVGIGASTAIFSVVNAVLLRSLPYSNPERLANIWGDLRARNVQNWPFSGPDFDDLRRNPPLFDAISGINTFRPTRIVLVRAGAGADRLVRGGAARAVPDQEDGGAVHAGWLRASARGRELAVRARRHRPAGAGKWMRNFVVVTEVALSFVLLVGSGLMARTFVALQRVDPGFDARRRQRKDTLAEAGKEGMFFPVGLYGFGAAQTWTLRTDGDASRLIPLVRAEVARGASAWRSPR